MKGTHHIYLGITPLAPPSTVVPGTMQATRGRGHRGYSSSSSSSDNRQRNVGTGNLVGQTTFGQPTGYPATGYNQGIGNTGQLGTFNKPTNYPPTQQQPTGFV